jgi:surface protein
MTTSAWARFTAVLLFLLPAACAALFELDDGTIHSGIHHWLQEPTSAAAKYGSINDWDTSRITDMRGLFRYATGFNEDISKWNTSSVTTFREMFFRAEQFNADVSKWQTSRVLDMSYAFG